jgi:hypothetical protein
MKTLQFSPKDTSHFRRLESPIQVVLAVGVPVVLLCLICAVDTAS